jgi:hypothetical protein
MRRRSCPGASRGHGDVDAGLVDAAIQLDGGAGDAGHGLGVGDPAADEQLIANGLS